MIHHRTKLRGRRTGLTVLELMVSLVLLSVVLGGVIDATDRGLDLFRQTSMQGEITARAGRTVHRIAKELLAADDDTLVPDLLPPQVGPNTGSSTVDFREAEDFVGGVLVRGPLTRIQWEIEPDELPNDLDDDGDGIIDEGSVVLIRNADDIDELRTVIANGVREFLEGEFPNGLDDNGNGLVDERGLSFDRSGDVVFIRLSLERPDASDGTIIRTHLMSISLRN